MAKKNNTTLGYEMKLWQAADKLRGSIDPAEYKHVVLGLIFLKYVSDAFESKYKEIKEQQETTYADPEDKDEYISENLLWVPKKARWSEIKKYANNPKIGTKIDSAMKLIEKENKQLKGILNKNYSRPELDKTRLGELVTLISNIDVGTSEAQEKDILGRVYEYFLNRFASAEGKGGGEFYTPTCIVKTLVEMLEPFKGRVYDPCCGSGGMFVQSAKFVKKHNGNIKDISVYGQESNHTTWKLAKVNLAIRGIDNNLGPYNADTFHNDLHKNLKANYIMANPPFNISAWGGERLREDYRWKYGTPSIGNANYAWLQHALSHLYPNSGVAGIVLANGSLTIDSADGKIRNEMIKKDVIECIVAMPQQLFYTTQIPCCLWIMRKKKNAKNKNKILFIDAKDLGHMVDRKVKDMDDEDIQKIAQVYHNWRKNSGYKDEPGFCKEVDIDEVINEGHDSLNPGRYVGMKEEKENEASFDETMKQLLKEISEQFKESKMVEEDIRKSLGEIGYEI